MDENRLIEQVLKAWQCMATEGPLHQDAFLLLMCVIAVVMLFFTGTVIGLFLQSLWGIFVTHHNQTDADH
ncbi:MAG: hypothetical protein ACAH05_05115 [Methylophilus sp.]|nr:hypothetical protein [Methyloradius sp.]